eukprot:m.337943 g.337943  ORF g.337943 m.337943 type:complete len:211 (-) comp18270_c0_seq1:44-676(-)
MSSQEGEVIIEKETAEPAAEESVEKAQEDGADPEADPDMDIAEIEAQLQGFEEEAAKLKKAQEVQNEKMLGSPGNGDQTEEERLASDARSIFVGNCDYSATDDELKAHFVGRGCGEISRLLIRKDKFTQRPLGCAYIEFKDQESVELALSLHDSLFKGRQITVAKKRTNISGFNKSRGRGGRRGRGGFRGRGRFGRRGGRRGRGRGFFPY